MKYKKKLYKKIIKIKKMFLFRTLLSVKIQDKINFLVKVKRHISIELVEIFENFNHTWRKLLILYKGCECIFRTPKL